MPRVLLLRLLQGAASALEQEAAEVRSRLAAAVEKGKGLETEHAVLVEQAEGWEGQRAELEAQLREVRLLSLVCVRC